HQVGKMRRLTVAVAVDNKAAADAKPGDAGTALDPEQLERLAILVRNAVGYDAARGDVVNVVNTPFVPVVEEDFTPEKVPFYQQAWVLSLAKQGVGLLLVLALIFVVLRPVMKSLSQGARDNRQQMAGGMAMGDMSGGGPMGALSNETVTLSGAQNTMLLPGTENSYDQQLTAIKGLIAEDPGRVAQVVKKWVATSE
ncbi:MAG TPA: flagellar M-ring protein FliF C-terminal domain-containing protein, partial [Spongiibacteraceae bacterium]|nr:flagellar M-ring protein FliF C-terminal domain-containing protein [Spongiibacteraceae bacterium]